MAIKRISLTRGDSDNYGVTFKKGDGTLYDMSGWTVYFTLKTSVDLTDASASLQKIVNVSSGTSGSANIPILPADTVNLDPGEYDFDIAVLTNASAKYTVLKGKLNLEYDVTRT